MRGLIVFCVVAWQLLPSARAQSAATILGSDSLLWQLRLVPGAIETIAVMGLTPTARFAYATSTPLPTTLAGISATVTQTNQPRGPIPIPILAVNGSSSLSSCNAPSCNVVDLTVQVPFELIADIPGCGGCLNVASITISDGTTSATAETTPSWTDIHVLFYGVRHADGSPVTASSPALPGEEIVMYATGLGLSNPLPKTGDVTQSPAPIAGGALSYDFRLNASPSLARTATPDPYVRFIGMSPGSVGLYQANFVVPPPPASLAECDNNFISSNLTVTLVGLYSFDGASICVKGPGH